MNQAETFYIKAVDNTNINNPVLTLDSPLLFTHFAKTENYEVRNYSGELSKT